MEFSRAASVVNALLALGLNGTSRRRGVGEKSDASRAEARRRTNIISGNWRGSRGGARGGAFEAGLVNRRRRKNDSWARLLKKRRSVEKREEKTKRKRKLGAKILRKRDGGAVGWAVGRGIGAALGKKIFSASDEKDFNDFALFRSGKIRYTAQAASAVWGDERTRGKLKSRFRRRYY